METSADWATGQRRCSNLKTKIADNDFGYGHVGHINFCLSLLSLRSTFHTLVWTSHHILTYLHPSLEDQILKSRAKPLFSQLPKNEIEPPHPLNFT